MRATREMNNAQYVDWKNISKNHRTFFVYRMSLWGEWWVEIALIAQAAILQTKKARSLTLLYWFGGDNRDRTDDLLNAIQALSQLSYIPVSGGYDKFRHLVCQY